MAAHGARGMIAALHFIDAYLPAVPTATASCAGSLDSEFARPGRRAAMAGLRPLPLGCLSVALRPSYAQVVAAGAIRPNRRRAGRQSAISA